MLCFEWWLEHGHTHKSGRVRVEVAAEGFAVCKGKCSVSVLQSSVPTARESASNELTMPPVNREPVHTIDQTSTSDSQNPFYIYINKKQYIFNHTGRNIRKQSYPSDRLCVKLKVTNT